MESEDFAARAQTQQNFFIFGLDKASKNYSRISSSDSVA